MLDNHYTPEDWGIIRNFHIGNNDISSYTLFITLGLLAGLLLYILTVRKDEEKKKIGLRIAFVGLLGGAIGAKIPVLIENFEYLIDNPDNIKYFVFSGKSIVGGIIGGFIAVLIVKKVMNVKDLRFGNQLAPAIALGMAIGRLGCFFTGCCYGIATKVDFYGVDFGDGILRHPTQLYEIVFDLILFVYLLYKQKKCDNLKPGQLFVELVNYYFIFRFFIEFIRETEKNLMFLSIYQWICLGGIIFINLRNLMRERKNYGK